jgi:hypothetical protein
MPVSPVPIYLGCAGLVIGGLGFGAQHLLSGGSAPAASTASKQPLFAQSVEEASLPASRWPSQHRQVAYDAPVAYYEPMVQLLTLPARSSPSAPAASRTTASATPPANEGIREQPQAAPREVVRDVASPPKRQSRRSRSGPAGDDAVVSSEQADPRETRAREARESRSRERQRRHERHGRSREDERRVVIREEAREPGRRIVHGPEPRDGVGFSPFGLFGIFDR